MVGQSKSNALLEKPKKSKKQKREKEDKDESAGEMPERDEEAEAAGERRKQKKQKKKKEEPEPEQEEDEEDEEGVEGEEGEAEEAGEDHLSAAERAARKLRSQRKHKKLSGYRNLAKACGYIKKVGVLGASGIDSTTSFVTEADAKRAMRFYPEVLNKSSFDKVECQERMKLSMEAVPPSAARVTQAHMQEKLTYFMNQATLRTAEKGTSFLMRIDAATMYAVIRPYQVGMSFTGALPPKGLIRHAQNEGKLSASAADEEAVDTDKLENTELLATQRKMDKEENDRKKAYADRRAEAAATKTAAGAAKAGA